MKFLFIFLLSFPLMGFSKSDMDELSQVVNKVLSSYNAQPKTQEELDKDLVYLSRQGLLNEVQFVLNRGANVNSSFALMGTPLHQAAGFNADPKVTELLLSAGAKVNVRNEIGDTPLHLSAFENNNLAVIRLLLSAGAEVNALNKYSETPLHRAGMAEADIPIIQELVEAGAHLFVLDDFGATPMDYIRWNYTEEVEDLVLQAEAKKDSEAMSNGSGLNDTIWGDFPISIKGENSEAPSTGSSNWDKIFGDFSIKERPLAQ